MEAGRDGGQLPHLGRECLWTIFTMLNVNDLKSCRQVCSEWCQETTDILRNAVRVVSLKSHDPQLSDFIDLMAGRVGEGEESALPDLPFKVDMTCELTSLPHFFWKICGAAITTMSLEVASLSGDAFRNAVFKSCVDLEALKIQVRPGKNVDVPREWVSGWIPRNLFVRAVKYEGRMLEGVSWREILKQFPSLEKFEAKGFAGSLTEFFHALAIARRHDDDFWKIKHLSFSLDSVKTPLAIVPALEDRDLPLTTLEIDDIDRPEDAIALRRILAAHAPTLMDLSLSGGCVDSSQVMEIFPLPNDDVFENVTRLHLKDAYPKSVNFLQSFPSLTHLELDALVKPTSQFAQEPVDNWIIDSCSELSIQLEHFRAEDLSRLLSMLPNLEKLKASHCKEDHMEEIYELMPSLIHLQITGSPTDD